MSACSIWCVGAPISEFTDKALDAARERWRSTTRILGASRARDGSCAAPSSRAGGGHLSKSVELNPSFALGYAGLGYALACGGEPERGLQSLEQAQRLSPRDPFLAFYAPTVRYMALFALGALRRGDRRVPRDVGTASQSRGSMALDDRIIGAAGPDRRSQAGAGAHADSATRPFRRSRRKEYGIRKSVRSLPLSFGAAESRIERLAGGPGRSEGATVPSFVTGAEPGHMLARFCRASKGIGCPLVAKAHLRVV